MTDPTRLPDAVPVPAAPWSAPEHALTRQRGAAGQMSDRTAQVRASAFVIAVLAVLGAVLGLVWEAWSPPGPAGGVLPGGIQADETEAFVAGDGRFALLTVIVGLVAGVAVWFLRRVRGPYLAIALAVGGVAGAALTEWVGYLSRGQGSRFACSAGTGTCIDHLPLTVHMHSLLLVEATAAVLVYSLFVAFAVSDDLGRPDPRRVMRPPGQPDGWPPPAPVGSSTPTVGPPSVAPPLLAPPLVVPPSVGPPSVGPPSVGPQGDLQDRWRYGDGAGPA